MSRGVQAPWSEHFCVSYASAADRLRAARRFTAGAFGGDERLVYVAAGAPDDDPVVGWLRSEAPAHQIQINRVEDVYAGVGRFDGPGTVQAFRDMKAAAQADGFRTLRAMADLTALATNPATFDDLLAYELLIDEAVEEEGLHGLCFYDAGALSHRVAPLHCTHPGTSARNEPSVAIRGRTVRLGGELDLASRTTMTTVLERVPPDTTVVELDDLGFLDVAGANALAGFAAERRAAGVDLEIRGGSELARLVLDTFGLVGSTN